MAVRFRRKIAIITGIVLVVLLLAGAGVFMYRDQLFHLTPASQTKTAMTPSAAGQLSQAQVKVVNQGSAAADSLYSSGDVSGAVEVYDEYIKKSSGDSQVVASLSFSKGLMLLNAGQYDEALTVGNALESSSPSSNSAMLIGEASSQIGNINNAVTYYKLAIERYKKIMVLPPSDAEAEAAAAKKFGSDYKPSAQKDSTLLGYESRLAELQR